MPEEKPIKEFVVQVAEKGSAEEINGVWVYPKSVYLFVQIATSDSAGSVTEDTILALQAALDKLKGGVLEG